LEGLLGKDLIGVELTTILKTIRNGQSFSSHTYQLSVLNNMVKQACNCLKIIKRKKKKIGFGSQIYAWHQD
jgi:hypothetical protein